MSDQAGWAAMAATRGRGSVVRRASSVTTTRPQPSPTPTKAVTRSGRLVTARTTNGGTQSYNCLKPENAKRAVCKGATAKPAVTPK